MASISQAAPQSRSFIEVPCPTRPSGDAAWRLAVSPRSVCLVAVLGGRWAAQVSTDPLGGRMSVADAGPRYVVQNSSQTLAEGIAEYYACNPRLLDPEDMPDDVAELFRQHDAGHVAFGCDTSLRGETLIDTWTLFGSSAGWRGYVEYFKYPQVNQVFAQAGYGRIAVEFFKCLPEIGQVILRSRRLSSKWPWPDYRRHLDQSLGDLRQQFGIRVV